MNGQDSKRIIQEYANAMVLDRQAAMEKYIEDQHLKDHVIMIEEGLPGYQVHFEDIIAEGDKVACRCQIVGTHTGTLFGVPASGNNVKVPLFVIYQIQNGRIVNFWMQADTLSLLQQIGAIPVTID